MILSIIEFDLNRVSGKGILILYFNFSDGYSYRHNDGIFGSEANYAGMFSLAD